MIGLKIIAAVVAVVLCLFGLLKLCAAASYTCGGSNDERIDDFVTGGGTLLTGIIILQALFL